ncbi:MAG TPA: GDSL-type esterase/lipase family protein [Pyrinomonadaceae bacterium]
MATSEKLIWPRAWSSIVWTSKPARTIAFVIFFAFAPLAIPALRDRLSVKGESYRELLPHASELVSFKEHSISATAIASSSEPASEIRAPPKPATQVCADQLIEDPDNAMLPFNESLARTDDKVKGAITRVTHYGDSPITNDGITGTTRQLLQQRFGDSGHGFILIDRPWDWYGHQAITFNSGGGWSNGSLMTPRTRDGEFGLGGVAFFSSGAGNYARYGPASDGPTGKKFTRFEAYYLERPNGGQFSISADDQDTKVISTAGDQEKSGFVEIKAGANGGSFSIKTLGGDVRMFGAVLENDDPGVVYDSLGVNGAFAGLLATAMNEQHWSEQLQHRNPNLVILNYGTNESEYASDDQMQRYERELREVVRRVRTALPNTSILIVSPMDRGQHALGGKVVTLPAIPKIVEMQRRVARETHCAFLNMYQAMGGEGTMARWHDGRKHLVGADLTHPSAIGAQTVGTLLYMALMESYVEYREKSVSRHVDVAGGQAASTTSR